MKQPFYGRNVNSNKYERVIKTNVATEYYIVFLPKHENKQSWNELKLLLKISEIPYLVFRTPDIDYIQVHEINQEEYNYYYYNPN